MDSARDRHNPVSGEGDWPVAPSASASRAPRRPTSLTCSNCDAVYTRGVQLSPYCGTRCRSAADAVRYGRRLRLKYGDSPPEDRSDALRIRIAHALGAGYRAGARTLSRERRAEVIARDNGLCVVCDVAGQEIDHIDGDSDALSNLRYLCKRCHRDVTDRHLRPIVDNAMMLDAANLRSRIASAAALRACDHEDWSETWRAWALDHATTTGLGSR